MNRIAISPPHPSAWPSYAGKRYGPSPEELAAAVARQSDTCIPSLPAPPGNIDGVLTPDERELYPKLFRAADKRGRGSLSAQEGAQFLMLSKLPRKALHDIWCLADSDNKGCLNIDEFYQACRLVAHAQNGASDITADLITVPPSKLPVFDGVEVDNPPLPTSALYSNSIQDDDVANGILAEESANGIDLSSPVWRLSRKHIEKYTEVFKALSTSGFVAGADARDLLLKSHLSSENLIKIWDLSDVSRDGQLSYPEFLVAMHLVTMARAGYPVPDKRLPVALASILRNPPVIEEVEKKAGPVQSSSSPSNSSSSMMDLTASVRSIAPSTEEVITEEGNDENKLSHTASLPDLKHPAVAGSVEGGVVPHTAPQLNAVQSTGEEDKADDDEKVAPTLRETIGQQLRQQQQLRQSLMRAGARLEALRQENRVMQDKQARLEKSIETSEKAMLLTKRWLDEARKDVDEAKRLAGETTATVNSPEGNGDEEDIHKRILYEKERLNKAEATVKELQEKIKETYRRKRTLQKQNEIWLERQRQAEQDRGLVITALDMQKAKLVAVRAERLRTCEGRYHATQGATRSSIEEWQRTVGSAPRLPASMMSLGASTQATPSDSRKGIPTQTYLQYT